MNRVLPRSHSHAVLADERERLNDILETGEGTYCRLCKQHAQVYRRVIFSTMAKHLITAYQKHGREWFQKSKTIKDTSGNWAKLSLWGLIEEESVRKPDGGRSGWWRLTPLGVRFVKRRETLPKWVLTYNADIIEVDDSVMVGIEDALGTKFRYDDLMRGV
jgi:hypothetical protein